MRTDTYFCLSLLEEDTKAIAKLIVVLVPEEVDFIQAFA